MDILRRPFLVRYRPWAYLSAFVALLAVGPRKRGIARLR